MKSLGYRKNRTPDYLGNTAETIAAELAIVKSAPSESLSADERRRLANLVTRAELLQLTLAFLPADAKDDATALASGVCGQDALRLPPRRSRLHRIRGRCDPLNQNVSRTTPRRIAASASVLRVRFVSWKNRAPRTNVMTTENRRSSEPTEIGASGIDSPLK